MSATAVAGTSAAHATGRWTIVWMVAALLFINYVDRGALPTAAHAIQSELHLDPRQLGILLSAFFWVYSWAQLPVSWIADRFGAARVLAGGLVVWAVATLCMGAARGFATLLALRMLLGLGESVGFPGFSKLLSEVVPPKQLGTANGIVTAAYVFGPAVGAFVGAKLIAAYGWRTSFLVLGCLPFLWLLPWSRVRLPPRAAHDGDATAKVPFGRILRQRALWASSLGLFSSNYCFFLSITWLPEYLQTARGLTTEQMGNVAGSAFAIMALTSLVSGWATDRWLARHGSVNGVYKWIMGLSSLGTMLAMLAMAAGSRDVALAGLYAYQVICGVCSPGLYAIPQIMAGPNAAARWVGVQNCIGNFAGVLAPWITGEIVARTHQFTYAFALAGLVALLGVVGWVWMLPRITPIHWARGEGA